MRRLLAVLAIALGASAAAAAGDLRILTDPEGAEVAQGSLQLGVTTKEGLRVVGVEAGTTIVFTITKAGFETVTRSVSVESATEPVTILVRLRPTTPGAPEATPTTPNPEASAAPSPVIPRTEAAPETAPAPKRKGGAKTAVVILGGAAVVGAGVAAGRGSGTTASTTTTTTLPRKATLADLSATVTSPQNGAALNCNESAYFTVSLTNAAPALVYVTGVRLHTTPLDGGCTGTPDYTYTVTNPQVGTGTGNVLTNRLLFTGGVGCCESNSGCAGSCSLQCSFTVLTSVGDVPAGHIDFGIMFKGCPLCPSLAGFSAVSCPAKP